MNRPMGRKGEMSKRGKGRNRSNEKDAWMQASERLDMEILGWEQSMQEVKKKEHNVKKRLLQLFHEKSQGRFVSFVPGWDGETDEEGMALLEDSLMKAARAGKCPPAIMVDENPDSITYNLVQYAVLGFVSGEDDKGQPKAVAWVARYEDAPGPYDAIDLETLDTMTLTDMGRNWELKPWMAKELRSRLDELDSREPDPEADR